MSEGSKIFSTRIKQERDKLGLSQRALADSCDIAYNTYQSWEMGRRTPNMNSSTLANLAKFFKVSPLYLLGETDFRSKWEEYDKLHEEDLKRIRTELQFMDSAEALGLYHQGSEDPEKDYEEFMTYNKMYQERKKNMKTRSDVSVVIGSAENRIIENFVTGEITIQAVSEEDVERGFQHLIQIGIIADQ